jgi:hypothetical protein
MYAVRREELPWGKAKEQTWRRLATGAAWVEAMSSGTSESPVRAWESEKREREKGERRKKGHVPVQVCASHANWTGTTESHRLLWCDWWTHGVWRLGHQSRQSRRRDWRLHGTTSSLRRASAPWVTPYALAQLLYKSRQPNWCDWKWLDLKKKLLVGFIS